MLTEIYIEALLVDEELAEQVWKAWDSGEIDHQMASLMWWLITLRCSKRGNQVEIRKLSTIL